MASEPTPVKIGRTHAHTRYKNAGGERVQSVTTIINQNLGWNKNALLGWTRKLALQGIDPWAERDKAGSIGTITHAMIEANILGTYVEDLSDFPTDDVKMAEAGLFSFQHWAESVNFQPKHTELRLVSESLQTGGTLDLIGVIGNPVKGRNKWSLVDIKTSNSLHQEMVIQVAAYQELYREHAGRRLEPYILWIDKETGDIQLKYLGKDLSPALQAFYDLQDLARRKQEIITL